MGGVALSVIVDGGGSGAATGGRKAWVGCGWYWGCGCTDTGECTGAQPFGCGDPAKGCGETGCCCCCGCCWKLSETGLFRWCCTGDACWLWYCAPPCNKYQGYKPNRNRIEFIIYTSAEYMLVKYCLIIS